MGGFVKQVRRSIIEIGSGVFSNKGPTSTSPTGVCFFLLLTMLVCWSLLGCFLDFVLQDPPTKRWFEVGDKMAREKIGQAFRAALSQQGEEICTSPLLLGGPVKKRRKSKKPAVVKKLHTSLLVDDGDSSSTSSSYFLPSSCGIFFKNPCISMLDHRPTSSTSSSSNEQQG
jgi:hypothetical protein